MAESARDTQIRREQERLDQLERLSTVPDDQLHKMIESYWKTYREERDRLEPFYYERIRRLALRLAPDAVLLLLEPSDQGSDAWTLSQAQDANGHLVDSDPLHDSDEFLTLISDLAHWDSTDGKDILEVRLT